MQLAYQGARMEVKVDQEKAEFILVDGEELSFKVNGTEVELNTEHNAESVRTEKIG